MHSLTYVGTCVYLHACVLMHVVAELASMTNLARCSTRMNAFPFCHACLQCASMMVHVYVQMCMCVHVCVWGGGAPPSLASAVCLTAIHLFYVGGISQWNSELIDMASQPALGDPCLLSTEIN